MTKMMGMYSVQTDHPGLMPDIDKKRTTKQDRSLFMKDKDAKKQYIEGEMKSDGTVLSKINKRLENE